MKMGDGNPMVMPDGNPMVMPDGKPMEMPGGDSMRIQWPHFANMALAIWLVTGVFALGYRSGSLQVSDAISGSLVLVFSIFALSGGPFLKFWSPWANALLGVWLLFAPVLLWAPTSGVYANDTLVGALVVVFAILAPGMPMVSGMRMQASPDIPNGWSYNPSSWPQRAPIIALALLGFLLSRQMASFELGHIATIADPIFGLGTQRVLTSTVSRSFPIPDAGLGAFAYAIEFLMGFMGDKSRWRTMPWMVTFFGILVVPLGVVSIMLIILQPLAVGAWCTPCLVAAIAMLIMIALTLDEVVAMLQFLAQARREGQSLWRTFWLGGALRESTTASAKPSRVSVASMLWGTTLPWNLVASAGLGIWLMSTPAMFATVGTAGHSEHLVGALIVSAAVIALSEVGRSARFINVVFGAFLILSPWLFAGGTTTARLTDAIVGLLVILLSLRRGPIRERYGSWEKYIR